jgi:hypothetical protein
MSTSEKEQDNSNFAQRFEKRIWKYNESRNVVKRWLLEIISWILSALCMAGIVGILIFLKDEKLPNWPFGLTLNAYISVLSKIAGAALLLPTSEALGQLKWSWFQDTSKTMWDFEIFDNASRGPWGSFMLLIRTKGRYVVCISIVLSCCSDCKYSDNVQRSLAALGAAVTLFALALDPFFQQVVDFPERWICDGNSSIPRVVQFDPLQLVQFKNGQRTAQQNEEILAVSQQFFYDNGTQPIPFGNGTRAEIPLSCPTSNCTWPAYESLGVCSKCVDVTEQLDFACLTTTVDWISTLIGGPENVPLYPNGTVCGWFLNATSNSPVLMSGYNLDPLASSVGNASAGEALLMRILPLTTNPARIPLYGIGSINFGHIPHRITDFIVASAIDGSPDRVYRNETPVAHECMLAWCVKTIKSSYYWANYAEEVTNTFLENTTSPSSPFKFLGANYTGRIFPENITINPPFDANNTSAFGLKNDTAVRIINVFDDITPSFYTAANVSADPLLRFRIYKAEALTRLLPYNPWIHAHNVTQHMERLATAITNTIRSTTSKEMVYGRAYSKEHYVQVRWQWLALPLSLLLLSLGFLVATVLKTSREQDRVGVWKTSAIATLMYGLPDAMQNKIKSSTSSGTPRAKAKELRMKLLPKMGWRVSGNLFSPMPPKVNSNQPPPGWI